MLTELEKELLEALEEVANNPVKLSRSEYKISRWCLETIVKEAIQKAKGKARAWYKETGLDYPWHESDYEDFDTIAGFLGLYVKEKRFSGFWSQGDGASFSGRWNPETMDLTALKEYAPKDETLHKIGAELLAVKTEFESVRANISFSNSRYCHSNTMQVDVILNDDIYQDLPEGLERRVERAIKSLADWLYSVLENTYEALNSDECISEVITANEYTFTESGKRFG